MSFTPSLNNPSYHGQTETYYLSNINSTYLTLPQQQDYSIDRIIQSQCSTATNSIEGSYLVSPFDEDHNRELEKIDLDYECGEVKQVEIIPNYPDQFFNEEIFSNHNTNYENCQSEQNTLISRNQIMHSNSFRFYKQNFESNQNQNIKNCYNSPQLYILSLEDKLRYTHPKQSIINTYYTNISHQSVQSSFKQPEYIHRANFNNFNERKTLLHESNNEFDDLSSYVSTNKKGSQVKNQQSVECVQVNQNHQCEQQQSNLQQIFHHKNSLVPDDLEYTKVQQHSNNSCQKRNLHQNVDIYNEQKTLQTSHKYHKLNSTLSNNQQKLQNNINVQNQGYFFQQPQPKNNKNINKDNIDFTKDQNSYISHNTHQLHNSFSNASKQTQSPNRNNLQQATLSQERNQQFSDKNSYCYPFKPQHNGQYEKLTSFQKNDFLIQNNQEQIQSTELNNIHQSKFEKIDEEVEPSTQQQIFNTSVFQLKEDKISTQMSHSQGQISYHKTELLNCVLPYKPEKKKEMQFKNEAKNFFGKASVYLIKKLKKSENPQKEKFEKIILSFDKQRIGKKDIYFFINNYKLLDEMNFLFYKSQLNIQAKVILPTEEQRSDYRDLIIIVTFINQYDKDIEEVDYQTYQEYIRLINRMNSFNRTYLQRFCQRKYKILIQQKKVNLKDIHFKEYLLRVLSNPKIMQ